MHRQNKVRRYQATFQVTDIEIFKQQMLSWANRFNICCFMDSNAYEDAYHQYDVLAAVDAAQTFSSSQTLQHFLGREEDWLFGNICYDYGYHKKNRYNLISFPDLFFFQPKIVLYLRGVTLAIECLEQTPHSVFTEIQSVKIDNNSKTGVIHIQHDLSKQQYIEIIQQIKSHILRGDCYELNFCQEFFAINTAIDPLQSYIKLSQLSPAPFATYYRINDNYLMSASPERFLQKHNDKLIAQPIKGTIKRDLKNSYNDNHLKQQLQNSKKDKQENVMVVDLLRNDLSKICKPGSVKVEELFGIYSYPQVHQMISTIAGELDSHVSFPDIIQATFPMGSMTGAPKQRVIDLIAQYEHKNRNLYSGSVAYITPQHNFDCSVVIRSIFYNAQKKYVSFWAGSGITFNSEAESEYEECLLKAAVLQKVLS